MKPPVLTPPTLPSLRVAASLGIVIAGTVVWGLTILYFSLSALGYAGSPIPARLQRTIDILGYPGPALIYFPLLLILWRRWLLSTWPDTLKALGVCLVAGLIIWAISTSKFVAPAFPTAFTNFVLAPLALLACMWGASPRILPPEPPPRFEPKCPDCGYDLRGQRECRCPECGRTFSLGEL